MIGTAHGFREIAAQPAVVRGGYGAHGVLGWWPQYLHGSVPSAQTTAAIRDVMRVDQFECGATAVCGAIGSLHVNGTLEIIASGSDPTAFWLNGNASCKVGFLAPTSPPSGLSVELRGWPVASNLAEAQGPSSFSAAPTLKQIREASGLTIEAMAPLIGVSRRTLHGWLAGGQIGQRNEERLRALAEALEVIAATAPSPARERLMERVPGSPRIFDLLAEGHYDVAVARATGMLAPQRHPVYPEPRPLSTPLSARVAGLDDRTLPFDGPTVRHMTKRIKR